VEKTSQSKERIKSVTLASTDNELPEDGVTAPKHIGAILM
jgi:hypothetical protein